MVSERRDGGDLGLLGEEDRLALQSALQELTAAVLRLFDPGAPLSHFLLQVCERVGCAAALCLELRRGERRLHLMGAAGVSRAARALPLDSPALGRVLAEPVPVDWRTLPLPCPELLSPGIQRWAFPMTPEGKESQWGLCLFFLHRPRDAPQLQGMLRRVAEVLAMALAHRSLSARLEEQRTLLQCENDASSEGILILSAQGRVASCNRRFLELWGMPPVQEGTSRGGLLRSISRQVRDPAGFLASASFLETHAEVTGTQEVELSDGRTFERYVAPIRNASGGHFGQGWYFRDITARKEVDAHRRLLLQREHAARTAAEEAVRKRDEFLSTAAHELKTPLTPLALRLDALVRAARVGGAPRVETLEKVQESLRKVVTLVNDLLDFSRLQSGRMVLRRVALRLDGLVQAVVANFRLSAPRHVFEVTATGELWVQGDPVRLEQVFTNLLDNAIKYSPSGGSVRIELCPQGEDALCAVTDRGIGIPKEEQVGLFGRFFRAGNAPTSHFAGLGLGLYISRQIVEGHGGRIWVESQVGEGATFFVTLPRAAPALRGVSAP